jgi:hypothetical protein
MQSGGRKALDRAVLCFNHVDLEKIAKRGKSVEKTGASQKSKTLVILNHFWRFLTLVRAIARAMHYSNGRSDKTSQNMASCVKLKPLTRPNRGKSILFN